jgi:hypothetical protein
MMVWKGHPSAPGILKKHHIRSKIKYLRKKSGMSDITHYRCNRDLLPMIEAALATNGYVITIPYQKSSSGATALVMACGGATVLLGCPAKGDIAEIQAWGDLDAVTASLLESLCRATDSVRMERTAGHYVSQAWGAQAT